MRAGTRKELVIEANRCRAGRIAVRVDAEIQDMMWNDGPWHGGVLTAPVQQLIDPAARPPAAAAGFGSGDFSTSSERRSRRRRRCRLAADLLTFTPALLLLGCGVEVLLTLVDRHQAAAADGRRRSAAPRRPGSSGVPPALGAVLERSVADRVAAADVEVAGRRRRRRRVGGRRRRQRWRRPRCRGVVVSAVRQNHAAVTVVTRRERRLRGLTASPEKQKRDVSYRRALPHAKAPRPVMWSETVGLIGQDRSETKKSVLVLVLQV